MNILVSNFQKVYKIFAKRLQNFYGIIQFCIMWQLLSNYCRFEIIRFRPTRSISQETLLPEASFSLDFGKRVDEKVSGDKFVEFVH